MDWRFSQGLSKYKGSIYKMQTGPDNLSKIHGQIERITFANEENGFTIAKLKTKGGEGFCHRCGEFAGDQSRGSSGIVGKNSKNAFIISCSIKCVPPFLYLPEYSQK